MRATIRLDTIDHEIVYRGERHIFVGSSGDKERWIDTQREDVSYEFRGRTLTIIADAEYLDGKGLLKFETKRELDAN